MAKFSAMDKVLMITFKREISNGITDFINRKNETNLINLKINIRRFKTYLDTIKLTEISGFKNDSPIKFDKLVYAGIYKGEHYKGFAANKLNNFASDITNSKYHKDKEATKRIVEALSKEINKLKPDYITTVQGGDGKINHGRLLLNEVHKILHIPVLIDKKKLKGKTVCVIDDVIYTGATANKTYKLLFKYLPTKIYLAVYAKSEYYNI